MKFLHEDWKWASIAAVGLMAFGIAIVFGLRPGGFEGQTIWYLILLPFGLPASIVADFLPVHAPTLVYWPLLIVFNFFWYCLVSLVAIKIHRFLS